MTERRAALATLIRIFGDEREAAIVADQTNDDEMAENYVNNRISRKTRSGKKRRGHVIPVPPHLWQAYLAGDYAEIQKLGLLA